MNKTAITIPSRLEAIRLPNKPLELINNKEMILHVYEAAKKTNTGEVYVATPDQKIIDLIKDVGGKAVLTSLDHQTGTDRVYEVFKNQLKSEPNVIVNLQGDMPNLDSNAIVQLNKYMQKGLCDMATLASSIKNIDEISTHAFFGRELHPTAILECLPFEPNISVIKSEAPLIIFG